MSNPSQGHHKMDLATGDRAKEVKKQIECS